MTAEPERCPDCDAIAPRHRVYAFAPGQTRLRPIQIKHSAISPGQFYWVCFRCLGMSGTWEDSINAAANTACEHLQSEHSGGTA